MMSKWQARDLSPTLLNSCFDPGELGAVFGRVRLARPGGAGGISAGKLESRARARPPPVKNCQGKNASFSHHGEPATVGVDLCTYCSHPLCSADVIHSRLDLEKVQHVFRE